MKTALLFVICLSFFACSRKDSDVNVTNAGNEPRIAFDIDSFSHEYTGQFTMASGSGVDGSKVAATPSSDTYYTISGSTNAANTITLKIITPNDTLKPINYHYVFSSSSPDPRIATMSIVANNQMYRMITDGNFADITITSYQNGMIDGNFTGQVSRMISVSPLVIKNYSITNGVFKNVKIRYD